MSQTASARPGRDGRVAHDQRDQRDELWLNTLRQADRPLSQAGLFGRSGRASDKASLSRLLASGEVVNLASGQVMALATREDAAGRFSPVTLAGQAVLNHLGLGLKPLSLSAAGLGSVRLPVFARPHLRQAVAALGTQGQVVPLKMGSFRCVVGAAGIQHHLAQQTPAPKQAPQAAPVPADAMPENASAPIQPVSVQMVCEAYAQVLPMWGTMVEIGAIQRHLGCDLAALHATLRQMLHDAQIYLVQGEPTALSAPDQAAGLPVKGTTYYCIELCQG